MDLNQYENYKKDMKCAFLDDILSEEGGQLLKELILRGYHPLPLASEGIVIFGNEKVKGGEGKCIYLN